MKKFLFIALFTGLLVLITQGAFAEALSADQECYFYHQTIQISGSFGDRANIPVTAVVTEAAESLPTFTEENPPAIIEPIFTGKDGAIQFSFNVSDSFACGRYTVFLISAEGTESTDFVYMNENSAPVMQLLDRINRASSQQEMLAVVQDIKSEYGVLRELSEEETAYVAASLYFQRDGYYGKKYGAETALKVIRDAMYTAPITENTDIFTLMNEYAVKNGLDFGYIGQLSETEKVLFSENMLHADYTKRPFAETIKEEWILSKVKAAKTRTELQSAVLACANALEIQIGANSVYASVLQTKRYLIFEELFSQLQSLNTPKEIADAFAKECAKVKKATENQNNTGSGSSSGGSSSKAGSGLVTSENYNLIQPQQTLQKFFSDIDGHYCYNAVARLFEMGIINGYSDNTFRPDASVTRAEFAQMIFSAFQFAGSGVDFSDTKNHWAKAVIAALAANGIVHGDLGCFCPDDPISREDAAVIAVRALEKSGIDLSGEFCFDDDDSVSDYAKQAVAALAAQKIVQGYNGLYQPKDAITRGGAAVIINNLISVKAEGLK